MSLAYITGFLTFIDRQTM